MAPQRVLAKHPDVASRVMEGRALALSTAVTTPHPVLLTFNRTGTAVWELLDGCTPVADVLTALRRRYPHVPAHQLEQETTAFLDRLLAAQLVIVHDTPC